MEGLVHLDWKGQREPKIRLKNKMWGVIIGERWASNYGAYIACWARHIKGLQSPHHYIDVGWAC